MCIQYLKQGDSSSPVLFSLLINEQANEIVLKAKHGIALSPDLLQILIGLFADDNIVLLSNTIVGLQQQVDVLRDTRNRLHLVNFDKSQVVYFF